MKMFSDFSGMRGMSGLGGAARRGGARAESAQRRPVLVTAASILALMLAGCSALGASGPSTRAVTRADRATVATSQIKIIDLSDQVARRVLESSRGDTFSKALGDGVRYGSLAGPGDVLDISVWEAPPAALFGVSAGDPRLSAAATGGRGTTLPEQVVSADGTIEVPFVGVVRAAQRTTSEIEREIVSRLAGKAHRPQVIVRIIRNATANVTVVGDVGGSTRVPLTSRGERLLDVLASAGGARQPSGKTTIQITRANKVVSMPLDAVIRDPEQNVRLQADDVVTALFQPYSFIALGAMNHNAEVPFEAVGISLAQALGRVGGLQDSRADVKGVFVFRLEDPDALPAELVDGARTTPDGKIPVIYRADLRNPDLFFVAQGFPIRNKDVLYVSNAPVADLQKFVGIISSMAFSVAGIANVTP